MKKILTYTVFAAFIALSGSCSKEKEDLYPDPVNPSPTNPNNPIVPNNPNNPNTLPVPAQSFITTHFSGLTISSIEAKAYGSGSSGDGTIEYYKVVLSDGTKLEFTALGSCYKIKRNSAIPSTALPAPIVLYVQANFTGSIVEWEIKSSKQEVELSTGIKLIFDLNGNFVEIDE